MCSTDTGDLAHVALTKVRAPTALLSITGVICLCDHDPCAPLCLACDAARDMPNCLVAGV